MKTHTIFTLLSCFAFSSAALAQTTSPAATSSSSGRGSSAPYTEGAVWTLTLIKTKSGLADEYLRQITQTVKPVYEAEKNQKVILDYKILTGDAMGAQDFDVLIMVQ